MKIAILVPLTMQVIILISAMAADRVIGTQHGMPWDIPEEYQQYLRFIQDQTVIMGRRTYEIFGADLTSKHTIVISRSLEEGDKYTVANNLPSAIDQAQSYGRSIFVAGGASIYAQALPIADEMYLSIIKGEFEGIAYFPAFDPELWDVKEKVDHPQFEFVHYRRVKKEMQ